MGKYVIVVNGDMPMTGGCRYLSSVDKDGPHFSRDVNDAIEFSDHDKCILFAKGITAFQLVDVYQLLEKVIRSFEYVW